MHDESLCLAACIQMTAPPYQAVMLCRYMQGAHGWSIRVKLFALRRNNPSINLLESSRKKRVIATNEGDVDLYIANSSDIRVPLHFSFSSHFSKWHGILFIDSIRVNDPVQKQVYYSSLLMHDLDNIFLCGMLCKIRNTIPPLHHCKVDVLSTSNNNNNPRRDSSKTQRGR